MTNTDPTLAVTVVPALTSPARVDDGARTPLRIGVIQHEWNPDRAALLAWLNNAVDAAAAAGAQIVFTPEITLSRYPADTVPRGVASEQAEDLLAGATLAFAVDAAKRAGVFVQTSVHRKAEGGDGLGLNTSILVAPDGALIAATNKMHIPVTAGYFEDKYFREGPVSPEAAAHGLGSGDAYPVYQPAGLDGARLGLPTCWDEWFPEVARAYSLGGANLVAYPSAIGSEPDHPDFDTEPLWRQTIVGNGIANGLFMVAINRTGTEIKPDGTRGNTFYGSSFVSDPYGRVLAQAPRDRAAVLVVDLELEQREDWLALFPFLATRRPDSYGILTEPRDQSEPFGG